MRVDGKALHTAITMKDLQLPFEPPCPLAQPDAHHLAPGRTASLARPDHTAGANMVALFAAAKAAALRFGRCIPNTAQRQDTKEDEHEDDTHVAVLTPLA